MEGVLVVREEQRQQWRPLVIVLYVGVDFVVVRSEVGD